MIELDVEGEDISVQFGVLKDMILERIEQLKSELEEPMKWNNSMVRVYIRELVKQIRLFDNLFLKYNKGYKFPKSLTETLGGILKIREMLISELEREANRTLILKKRILEDILPKLAEEMLNYFKLVDSIIYLRDRNLVKEDTVFVEESEEGEEDFKELSARIRELLEMSEGDDALEQNAKETLLNLLDGDGEKFAVLLRIDPEEGTDVRSLGVDNETIRELKRLGIIYTTGRGRSRRVHLRPPYDHLLPRLIEAVNNGYVEED